MRVLLVEDNAELAGLVNSGLAKFGFSIDVVANVADARLALSGFLYSALILDIGLPDESGFSLLKSLRDVGDAIPVILLTARGAVEDRVQGLQSGADDYLVKPFAIEELAARLRALLRRPGQLLGQSLSFKNIVFDTEARQVFINGVPELLSSREASVLELLLRRQGRVVSKKVFEDQLFGLSKEGSPNAVEVYLSRLRKQLLERGADVQIMTVRGVGYMISEKK
ncbi:MAG: response regulator transcription factor [Rhizobiales bacterium]|nr:response regulator transcription factor [Hyphomicrobiales bacterium]